MKTVFWVVVGSLICITFLLGWERYQTSREITKYQEAVREIGKSVASPAYNVEMLSTLPLPVQRYFDFVFVTPPQSANYVEIDFAGDFRVPLRTVFQPTTAHQTGALGTPALIFNAKVEIGPALNAHAFDAFINGEMTMKTRIFPLISSSHEPGSISLDTTSLRRWLLESPLYPSALLPGGMVQWEEVDEKRARAVVNYKGLKTSLVATFNEDGSLKCFDAEEDGDLTTSYHGSGEHVLRSDYKNINGTMIPMSFSIARVADGQYFPFWTGRITDITWH